MKIAAAIINRFSRGKTDEVDAFETRLISMGAERTRRSRAVLPTLFVRAGRSIA